MDGSQLIAQERQRQIQAEVFTAEHDDMHDAHQLVSAAAVYMLEAVYNGPAVAGTWYAKFWPWDATWYKPKSTVRDLVRAGALIAAEIDRLQREQLRRGKYGHHPDPLTDAQIEIARLADILASAKSAVERF